MKPAQTLLNMCLTVFFHAVTTQCQLLLITCKVFLTRYRFKITFNFHGQPANCDFIVKFPGNIRQIQLPYLVSDFSDKSSNKMALLLSLGTHSPYESNKNWRLSLSQ